MREAFDPPNRAAGLPAGLHLQTLRGLSAREASDRLAQDGYNELPSSAQRGLAAVVREVAGEPMFLLLVACAGVYLVFGNLQEALILLGLVILVVLGLVLYVPALCDLVHFDMPHPVDLLICLTAGVVSIAWFEGLKLVWRQSRRPPGRVGCSAGRRCD